MVKQCITDACNASSILVRVVYKNLKSIISYKHNATDRVCHVRGGANGRDKFDFIIKKANWGVVKHGVGRIR